MLDNVKEILSQDITAPLMFGVVANAKAFIIDRAMLSLIVTFMGAGVICGSLLYQVNRLTENQAILMKTINEMAITHNGMSTDIAYMRRDIDKIATSFSGHLEGHMSMIAK